MNIIKIFTLTVTLLVSAVSNAGLMLTEDDYITVEHSNGISLDWAWASNYSAETYLSSGETFNTLYSFDHVDSVTGYEWREATDSEFKFFKDNVTSADFKRDGGGHKNAVKYFNSNVNIGFSTKDLDADNINNKFFSGSVHDDGDFLGGFKNYFYDTFYVRDTPPGAIKPIPEPMSYLIFITAFILLQRKLIKL